MRGAKISLGLTEGQLESRLAVGEDCKNLNDFLRCFELPLSLLQTETGIETAVYEVLCEQKRQGAVYAEVRFAPQLHGEKGLTQRQVINAALKGLEKSDIPSNFILCMMRGKENDRQNSETLDLCEKYLTKEQGVAALDLAGRRDFFRQEITPKFLPRQKEEKSLLPFMRARRAGAEDVILAVKGREPPASATGSERHKAKKP